MTKLCARGKSAAKRKFKVYPSAYANAYASKICAGKIKDPSGKKRKDWGPKKMNTGGEMDYGKQKKDKMKTKPYGMEDRKVKIEKLMSQKEKEKIMKGFKPYRASPIVKNTSAGKTAPPKYSVGGGADMSKVKTKKKNILDKVTDKLNKAGEAYKKLGEAGLNVLRGNVPVKRSVGGGADMSTIKKKKKKPAPGGGRERHEYMKNIQNPISEYSPDRKLKYTGAKVGMNVTAGGQSAMGRLEKSGMLKAYTGRAVRQPSETNKEFEMRHEYHTPFKKPQKAKGGGIAIKGTNFKGVF